MQERLPRQVKILRYASALNHGSWDKGCMPMVGRIAEIEQVVACEFSHGNASPDKENLAFIQQRGRALPGGCFVQSLQNDAAGCQK